ncbi:MAG: tetratricopeptide repeat protein, partial [Okeania sp. SIO3B3]|nr:tetratricopeptide repeat protein [Okeania sp. SIO3B3]
MTDEIAALEAQLGVMEPPQLKIDTLNTLAWKLRHEQPERAKQLSQEASELSTLAPFETKPYYQGLADSRRTLGWLCLQEAAYDRALSYLQEALFFYEETSNPRYQAEILSVIGQTYYNLGDYAGALEYNLSALRLYQAQDGQGWAGEAQSLRDIGLVYFISGDAHRALDYLRQGLLIYREHHHREGEASILDRMGTVYRNLDNYSDALTCGIKSLHLYRQLYHTSGEAEALGNLGA